MPKKSVKREPTEEEIQMKQLHELSEQQRIQIAQRDTICLRWHRRRHGLPEPSHEPYIEFVRGRPSDTMSINEFEGRLIVTVPDDMYRSFIVTMYLIAVLSLLFTIIPNLCLCLTKTDLTKILYLPYYVWLVTAVVLIIFAATCPPMRRTSPVNWIFAALIVIMLTIAFAYYSFTIDWIALLSGVTLSCILLVGCLTLGVHMPTKCLPGGTISTICIFVVVLAFIASLFLSIVSPTSVHVIVSASLAFFLIIAELLIHAQYVHGRRTTIPFVTLAFCSLTIYIAFLLIFVCLYIFYYYIRPAINDTRLSM